MLPNLRLFVITCLDPRVDPAHFVGLELNDATVRRNVGSRVTREVINDLAFPPISPRITVSGDVYDVVAGLVQTVLPAHFSDDLSARQSEPPRGDRTR
ncbi:MAG: hypothetical protein ACR2NR_23685 [Solirubrobacteraceae bacterium]